MWPHAPIKSFRLSITVLNLKVVKILFLELTGVTLSCRFLRLLNIHGFFQLKLARLSHTANTSQVSALQMQNVLYCRSKMPIPLFLWIFKTIERGVKFHTAFCLHRPIHCRPWKALPQSRLYRNIFYFSPLLKKPSEQQSSVQAGPPLTAAGAALTT